MNPEQLWEYHDERGNAHAAERCAWKTPWPPKIFSTLMGENVEERRKFIEDNALDVVNLDI
jgi:DNA gyrase subunit B